MPTQNQNSTRPDADWDSVGRFSDKAAMKQLFSGSPVFTEEMSPENLKKNAAKLLLRGEVQNGYGFSVFSRDYNHDGGPTDYSQPTDTSGGNPASAHVPNPASPTEGANNYSSIPAAPAGYGQTIGDTWGMGRGAELSPAESSEAMSRYEDGSSIHDNLVKGKSPQSVSSGS